MPRDAKKRPIDTSLHPGNYDPRPPGVDGRPINTPNKQKKKRKKFSPAVVALGTLYIRTPELVPKLSVTCLLGPTAPRVVGGYANWTLVSRRRRKALLEYEGKDPLLMEVPFLIDYLGDHNEDLPGTEGPGERCERLCHELEFMAGIGLSLNEEPPKLLWNANSPHDTEFNPYLLWVIEGGIEWDPMPIRNSIGKRIRQGGTFRLREWVGDEYISTAAELARAKATDKGLSGGGTYTVRKGDTLQNIARQKLGDSSRWREIHKLNKKKVRDPRKLKVGTVLKIPKI